MSPNVEMSPEGVKEPSSGYHLGRTRAPGAPLRRGDACLMCRAKKLKCSAQKPVCDQCVKRKDRCVYDAVRPASRVEKLQKKLAEMEEQEFHEAYEAKGQSSGLFAFKVPPSLPFAPTTGIGRENGIPAIPPQWNLGLLGIQPPRPTMTPTPALSAQGLSPLPTGASGYLTELHGTPPSAWPWVLPGSTDFSSEKPQPPAFLSGLEGNGQFNQSPLPPWSYFTTSNGNNSFLPHGLDVHLNGTPPTVKKEATPTPPSSSYPSPPLPGMDMVDMSEPGFSSTNGFRNSPFRFPIPDELTNRPTIHHSDQGATDGYHLPSRLTEVVDSVLGHKRALDSKALSANDMTEHARDYLLDLFFCPVPPRHQVGSEVFTEAEFRAKLALPTDEQPHACLLYSMYTMATSHSYIPAIRKLSEPLFLIAVSKIEEAIQRKDRLLDVINALKNLSKWLFSRARVLEGYEYSCAAISLCMACGLHRIPSSITGTESSEYTMQQSLLPPPKDQSDLRERIHAFWSAWGNDRGGSFTHTWPSIIRDDQITTPLPRPALDYFSDAVRTEPDITLSDLYDLPHRKDAKPLKTLFCYTLASCQLAHRAMTLSSLPPEKMASSYRALSHTPVDLKNLSPRRDHPVAYEEIMTTSRWLEETMPVEWRADPAGGTSGSRIEPDVPVIALCLRAARMHLHPLTTDTHDLETSLGLASDIAPLIKLWVSQLRSLCQAAKRDQDHSNFSVLSAFKGFSLPFPTGGHGRDASTRNIHGISGPYALSPSRWAVERLVKGANVLRGLGRIDEAQGCMSEAQAIVEGFKSLGTSCIVLGEHVKKLELIIKS